MDKIVKVERSFGNSVSIFVGDEYSTETHKCMAIVSCPKLFTIWLKNGFLHIRSNKKKSFSCEYINPKP